MANEITVGYICTGVLEGSNWEDLMTDYPDMPNFTIYAARHDKYAGKVDAYEDDGGKAWVDIWLKGPFTNESVCKALGEWLTKLAGTITVLVTVEEKGECIAAGE